MTRRSIVLVFCGLMAACSSSSSEPGTPDGTTSDVVGVDGGDGQVMPDGGDTVPSAALTVQQVKDLIAQKFNEANRDYTLWNIQPGLGTVMIEYGHRFALAYHAAQAGDWGMAQYQIKEALEIQEVGEVTRPEKAELLKDFEHQYVDPLVADIAAKNLDQFNADYESAIIGCNGCHEATGHPYVAFRMPQASPVDYLDLQASDPVTDTEEGEEEATEPPPPDETPVTSWEQLYALVDAAFDAVDRNLTLWNIQPGLGTVMIEYGHRFALAYHAVQAGDWGMAQYQLKEAAEIQEVGEVTRPGKADALKNFEHSYLDKLMEDVAAKDADAFETDYEAAVQGCNGCHEATGHAYVRFVTPATQPAAYLTLGPSDPKSPEEGEEGGDQAETPNYPEGTPTLDDALALIEERLDNIDRNLALWNIQPGLGTVMIEYGHRFALAYAAAEAGNWGMAEYQIKEALEIQEVGEVTRPGKAELLKEFESTYVDPVAQAVQNQDLATFEAKYDEMVQGCNGCHEATGHAYVQFETPTASPVDYLQLD